MRVDDRSFTVVDASQGHSIERNLESELARVLCNGLRGCSLVPNSRTSFVDTMHVLIDQLQISILYIIKPLAANTKSVTRISYSFVTPDLGRVLCEWFARLLTRD